MKQTFDGQYPPDKIGKIVPKELFLVQSDGVKSVRVITDGEFSAYEHARRQLADFGRGDQLLMASEANYHELGAAFVEIAAPKGTIESGESDAFANAQDLNRRLANYLSSMRTYTDFSEARTKRQFGGESAQTIGLKRALSTLFDDHFPYRFAYKLRNYSQHFGFPIEHVTRTATIDVVTQKRRYVVSVCFDVEKLLSTGKDLWKPLFAELQAAPTPMPIAPVVEEVPQHLRTLREHMVQSESASLRAAEGTISQLVNAAENNGARLRIGQMQNHAGRIGIEWFDPPQWAIDLLRVSTL